LARLRALAALEAEAGVEAGEALAVGERSGAPLLVVHEQYHPPPLQLPPRRELAHQAEGERPAALHVHGPGAGQAVALALDRPVRVVGDHGVEVAEQEELGGSSPAETAHEGAGVAGGGAVPP